MDTLVLSDDRCLLHDPGPGHPELASRLAAVCENLLAQPIPGTRQVTPRPAERDELLRVHTAAHVDLIESTAAVAMTRLDSDTATCADSHLAARLATGAVVEAVERAVAGEVQGAMCLVRPPGHHAESAAAMGFCLFNNVAVAAAHATAALGCQRVLVLDPDVHHGNGTQHVFEDRADVLYVSSHRFPFYPGTGAATEIGRGAGTGYTINLPLAGGMGDADLVHVYQAVVDPIVAAWKPDLILVSAGFDTWHGDPLGGMAVTEQGFAGLFALFRSWSEAHCPGRLVSALEGGYDPAGVTAGVRAALTATAADNPPEFGLDTGPSDAARAVTARVRSLLAPHWPVLRDGPA